MSTLGCVLGPYSPERIEAMRRGRYGDTTVEGRFWARVDRSAKDGCWPWRGAIGIHGYGVIGQVLAHRRAYELAVGPVPMGLELDHLCRNRVCVHPAHLEPVTHLENVWRANGGRTVCKRGHLVSGACLECRRDTERAYKARPESRERANALRRARYQPKSTRRRPAPKWTVTLAVAS